MLAFTKNHKFFKDFACDPSIILTRTVLLLYPPHVAAPAPELGRPVPFCAYI